MKGDIAWALRRFGPIAVLLAAGCGGKQAAFNEKVEGTVKIDGAPLTQVMVEFVPDDAAAGAPTATGYTDGKGHFQLTHDKNQPGAALGKHHVILVQGRPGGAQGDRDAQPDAPAAAPLPQVYTIAAKTPLQVEITATQHTYDLTVSSQGASSEGGRGRDD
ncbi:MAG TPA: hypothetical protein VMS17_18950 [Gemmataceae bacterium]|nr:hypothetical protein [Gemmataceae bacterium]